MDNGGVEKQLPNSGLDQVMDRIRTNAGNTGDGEGVIFIKDADPQRKDVKAANTIYDGLMLTLADISEDCLDMVRSHEVNDPKRARDYEAVLRAMEPITAACRNLAEGTIPLKRVEGAEEYYRNIGDNIYSYIAGDFKIGDMPFDVMSVFIRPKVYIRPSSVASKVAASRPEVHLQETAAPRMAIRLLPTNSSDGAIELRLDQEDVERGMEITYDIVVGERDRLRDLRFDKDKVGQREGHHFSSHFTAKELHVTFEQMLNAMNDKIAGSVALGGSSSVGAEE